MSKKKWKLTALALRTSHLIFLVAASPVAASIHTLLNVFYYLHSWYVQQGAVKCGIPLYTATQTTVRYVDHLLFSTSHFLSSGLFASHQFYQPLDALSMGDRQRQWATSRASAPWESAFLSIHSPTTSDFDGGCGGVESRKFTVVQPRSTSLFLSTLLRWTAGSLTINLLLSV